MEAFAGAFDLEGASDDGAAEAARVSLSGPSVPEAFKREAIERVRTCGLTIVAVAKELDVHETVLRRWIARYNELGSVPAKRVDATAAVGGLSPADLAAENARLNRENARLQTERDIP